MAIIPVRTFSVEIFTTVPHLVGAVCSALIHGQNVGSIVRNGQRWEENATGCTGLTMEG